VLREQSGDTTQAITMAISTRQPAAAPVCESNGANSHSQVLESKAAAQQAKFKSVGCCFDLKEPAPELFERVVLYGKPLHFVDFCFAWLPRPQTVYLLKHCRLITSMAGDGAGVTRIGQYILGATIGKGSFGKVKSEYGWCHPCHSLFNTTGL